MIRGSAMHGLTTILTAMTLSSPAQSFREQACSASKTKDMLRSPSILFLSAS